MSAVNQTEHGLISAGNNISLAVKPDGTVHAAGYSGYSAISVSGWSDIIKVAAASYNSIGLKANGTCLRTGRVTSSNDMAVVESWVDVVDIDANGNSVVALRADGTAYSNQYDVSGWQDVVQVSAGSFHCVGLTSTGQVLHAGSADYSLADATNWTDIVRIVGGYNATFGIKDDGTVVHVGNESSGSLQGISAWTDIQDIASGYGFTVGLRTNGTVLAAGNTVLNTGLDEWTGIVSIAGKWQHIAALAVDGSVLSVGYDAYGETNLSNWLASTGIYYPISGITSIEGTPTPMTVRAYESDTGAFKIETQSDANGQYTLHLPKWYSAYIMAIPPAGHRPMAHGPITPPPEDTQV